MSQPFRLVIIGGVAGGASAATRARRLSEDAEIILLERGPDVSFANCGLPYHIGGVIPERKRLLVQTPERLNARFDLDVRVNTEAIAIDWAEKVVITRNLKTGSETRLPYDALILSPGAAPIRPKLPGFDHPKVFTLRNLQDMDAILAACQGAKRALVVGAGYIGLELAESLRHRGLEVSLVERQTSVLGLADPEMAAPLHAELHRNGVDLRLGATVNAIEAGPEGLVAKLSGGEELSPDFVILSVGVRPETRLARESGLELGTSGGIKVDAQMRTSDPAIFAVGDAVEVPEFVSGDSALIPLAGPANRQGRIAAEVIFGRDSAYTASQGTAICKVFDLSFAMVGLSEKVLKAKAIPYRKVYVHPADHATYYPGAHALSLKLLFSPEEGRILGAQGVGMAGVDKRLDVLAVAQRAGLTVFDLEELELCYAPPFGSAKDPVNMAGFVAANVLRGDVELWEPEELPARSNQMLIDVRSAQEFRQGGIPGALNRDVDELRVWLEELPRDQELLLFCQVGLRGYLAARMLTQRGFKARNLSGGYKRWEMEQGFLPEVAEAEMTDEAAPSCQGPLSPCEM